MGIFRFASRSHSSEEADSNRKPQDEEVTTVADEERRWAELGPKWVTVPVRVG